MSEEDKNRIEFVCKCPDCPSKPSEAKNAYCYNDKSPMKVNMVTCICPTCEVYRSKNFTGTNFYCIVGRPITKIAGAELHEAVSGHK
jgi:hypothetical protein